MIFSCKHKQLLMSLAEDNNFVVSMGILLPLPVAVKIDIRLIVMV